MSVNDEMFRPALIRGHINQIESYSISQLGYDKARAQIIFKRDAVEIQLNQDDEFQKNLGYGDQIGSHFLWESVSYELGGLDKAVSAIYDSMKKAMKRSERELRYAMFIAGRVVDAGQSFRTHAGFEFVESMKAQMEKCAGMLNSPKAEPVSRPPSDFVDLG